MKPFALTLVFLLPFMAHAQVPRPGILNEVSGCGRGDANREAAKFCANYTEGKLFPSDPQIRLAYSKCVAFYEVAFRLQNTFCSYSTESVIFQVTSEAKKQEELVGEQNVSQKVVSADNRKVVEINKAYMAKFAELAERLKRSYIDYFASINKLNAAGGADAVSESQCSPNKVAGQVPGYLRELLAALSYGSARVTYESMMKAVRENYRNLKQVKEQAEENWRLAEMHAIDGGTVIKDVVEKPTEVVKDGPIKIVSMLDKDSVTGMFMSMFQLVLGRYSATLETVAGIVGGGGIVGVKMATGRPVDIPSTGLLLVSVLSPAAGLMGGGMLLQNRINQENLKTYENFCRDELSKNMNLNTMELMAIWAKRTENPSCAKYVSDEAACVEKRKTMQPYDHSSCSRGPLERGYVRPGSNDSTITSSPGPSP